MGRAAETPPSDFSRRLVSLVLSELTARGADRQWLAARTSRSANYIAIRLRLERSFTTTDIDEIAKAFGYSPLQFVQRAEREANQDDNNKPTVRAG